jgi:hypothetical protein
MTRKRINSLLLLFVVCMIPYTVIAAVTKVRIMEVDNISLGTWAYSSMTGNDAVCAYRNDGVGTYHITATDDSTITPGGFYLQNAADTQKIAYSLLWGNTPSPGSTSLADGVQASGSGANTSSNNCSGGDSANLRVDINNSALAAVPNGTYTATVTLVMTP